MTVYCLAVDPGINGGWVVADGKSILWTSKLPVLGNRLDPVAAHREFEKWVQKLIDPLGDDKLVFVLERQFALKGQGAIPAWTNGANFGMLEAVLGLLGYQHTIRLVSVSPSEWVGWIRRGVRGTGHGKADTWMGLQGMGLWTPESLEKIPRSKHGTPDDGIVDAVGMASYFFHSGKKL